MAAPTSSTVMCKILGSIFAYMSLADSHAILYSTPLMTDVLSCENESSDVLSSTNDSISGNSVETLHSQCCKSAHSSVSLQYPTAVPLLI